MNPKLVVLVSSIGLVASGLYLYALGPGVTVADAIDAGLLECPAAELSCPVRVQWGDAGTRYRQVVMKVRKCATGYVMRGVPDRVDVNTDRCFEVPVGTVMSGFMDVVPELCACATDAGLCQYQDDTGAWQQAYYGSTFEAGHWRGAGCHRKVCVESLGESSWPPECPQ